MKIIWYIFGVVLLIMAISTLALVSNMSCSSYDCGYNYEFYNYCRHIRNGFKLKFLIYLFGSVWCFGLGSRK